MFAIQKISSFIAALTLLYSTQAHCEDPTIFDMRKGVTLSDDEPTFRDFYINGGAESGLQPGMLITVMRKLTLYDTYQNRSPGDLIIKVGQLKIIHVQKGLAVGRVYNEFSRDNLPLLEDNYVMLGDKVDVKSAVMETKKGGKTTSNDTSKVLEPTAANEKLMATDFSSVSPSSEPSPVQGSVDLPVVQ